MKSTLRSRRTALILAGSVEALIVALTFNSTAIAASQIWTGTTDGTWATGANWGGSAPGATTGVISGDTATFNINANTAVAVDANRNIKNITFDTGAGAFTLSGGPLVLTNAGAITINSGVTNIETINTNILLSSTASSTYSFINNSFTVGANLVIGGSVTGQTTATAETLTLGGSNNGSVTGVIGNGSAGGTVALTKTGTGTWTLSNANTYTGNTTASGGTLKLDFTAAGAPATNIVSSSSVLKLGGGTLQIVGASGGSTQTFASTSFTAATGGLSVISAAPVTGTIPVVNLGTLTGTQGALVRFDGAAYNSGASSGTTLGGTTVAATATFNATTQTTTSGLISTNNGSGSTSSGGANAYATVGLYDWAAMSAGTAGAATGTSIVGGSQVSGFYTVGASLPLGGTGQNIDLTGSATFGANSTSTSSAYATIRVNAAAAITMTTGRALSENIVGGILITPNVGANNTSLVEQSGTNAQAFQASRGTTGATGVTIWQNNTLGEFIISSVYNNGTNSAATATYTQGGPGTVFLTPSIGGVASINGYTGQTYLDGGTTVINAFSGFGGGAAPTTLAAVNLNGGTILGNAASVSTDFSGSVLRAVNVGSNGGGLAASTGNTFTAGGVIGGAAGTGALVIGIPASSANGNVNGRLPGTGTGTANTTAVNATGTVILSNASNTYTGGTVLSSGTLQLTGAIGQLGTGGITLNGGTFQWGTSNTTDVSARTVTLASGGGTLDTNGNTVSLASSIGNGGSGALTVKSTAASGVLVLQGANTYTGGTTITSGTLKANNSTGSATGTGSVTIQSGATLGGTGTISGTVTVQSGGVFAPGNSVGTLTIGSLSMNAGSIYNYEFNNTPANDMTIVSTLGGLTINGGGFNLYNEGGITAFATPNTYQLIQYAGGIGGTGLDTTWTTISASNPHILNPQGGFNYQFGTAGGWITLTIAAAANIGTWGVDLDGNWSTAGNWTAVAGTMPPRLAGDSATFGTGSVLRTVTLDANETVGAITMNNANSFVIADTAKTLTLDNAGAGATITVTNGTLNAIRTAVALNDATTVNVSSGKLLSISGVISEAAAGKSLTKSGTGTLVLTGANSYTGGTTINAGVLNFAHAAASDGNLGATAAPVTFGGGTLQWTTGNTDDISSTRTVTIGAGGAIFDTNSNDVILANPIGNSSAGGLTKTGAGKLTLGGANTYTGTITINNGTLSVGANANLGPAATGAQVIFTSTGARLATTASFGLFNGAAGTNDRGIAISGTNGTLAPATGTTLTVSGPITGTGKFIKEDAGQVTIQNAVAAQNTFSGGSLISASKIAFADANANAQGLGTGSVTLDGGTLQLFSAGTGTDTGNFANNIVVDNGFTGTLITMPRGTIGGNLTGSGTFNYQTDYVRAQVTGNWSAFTGQINVTKNTNGGDFRLNNTNGFGTAKINLGVGVSMYDVVNFGAGGQTESIGELTGDSTSFFGGGPTAGRFLTWSVGGANTNAQFDGKIQDGGGAGPGPVAITKVGTQTWTLTGNNTYTGATAVNAGILQIGNGTITGSALTGTGTVTVGASGTLAVNLANNETFPNGVNNNGIVNAIASGTNALSGAITGTGSLVQLGSGTTTLSGSNSVATLFARFGTASITGSTAATNYASIGQLSGDNGTLTVQSGGSLTATAGAGDLNIGDLAGSTGTLNTAGTVSATNLYIGKNNDNLTSVATGTVNQSGGTVTVSGANGVILALNRNAVGTYNLNGGSLAVQKVSMGAGTSGVFNFNGGTLTAAASNAGFMTGLSSANVLAGGALINTGAFNVTIAQPLLSGVVNDGGLTKSGNGVLALTGNNTFTGATTINAGTLEAGAAGTLGATTSVAVNSGGTLLLSGSGNRVNDNAAVTLATSATGSFNTGGLSETVGTLTLSASSIIDMGAGTSILHFSNSDLATWTGTLSVWNWTGTQVTGGGTDQIYFGDGTGVGLSASQLLQVSFFSDGGSTLIGGYTSFVGSSGEIAPVPEPSSVATVMGLLGLIGWRERRKAERARQAGRKAGR